MTHQWTVILNGEEPTIIDADDLAEASNLAAELASGKPFSVSRIDPTDAHREPGIAKLIELGLTVEEVDALLRKHA